MGTVWLGSYGRVCAFHVRIHLNFANFITPRVSKECIHIQPLAGFARAKESLWDTHFLWMPRTVPVLGTSSESQVTFVGALHLCPVKEGEKEYKEKKEDGIKTGWGRQEQKMKNGNMEPGWDRSEWKGHIRMWGRWPREKLWEVVRNRDRMKENSWRGRREGRVITSKRSLDTEQGQRFHVFWISLASWFTSYSIGTKGSAELSTGKQIFLELVVCL